MEQTLDEVRTKGLGVRIWMRAYLEAYEGLNHKAFGTLAAMQANP
jgi:hypothetical protein